MKNRILDFLKEKQLIEVDLQKWVTDQSISLDERWEVFILSGLGRKIDGEFPGVNWSKHTFYDDFYMDRYSVQNVKYILEHALENNLFEKDGEILFKEFCLSKFVNQIENDW